MAKPVWKDTSSWSRDDTAETRMTPTSWTAQYKSVTVVVHNLGDAWFVYCYDIKLERADLSTTDPDVAKKEALKKVLLECKRLFESAEVLFKELAE